MASSKVNPNNFSIKLNYHDYDRCSKRLERLRKFEGVQKIKSDAEQKYWIISGTGDPDPIIKKLQNKNKWFELSSKPRSARNDHQKMQIVLPQKPVREFHENLVHMAERQPARYKSIAFIACGFLLCVVSLSINIICWLFENKKDEFELKSYTKRFSCDGCKEDGFGPRYRRDRCGSELHVECKSPKPTISHKLFEGVTFEFRRKGLEERLCDACGRDIHGYSYHCKAKGLDLHPRCSSLKGELLMGETDFALRNKVLSKCWWCNKKAISGAKTDVPGWSYVSRCNKYHFHVYCITQMVHQAWNKGTIDNIDDTCKALEAMDWKPMVSLNRKDGSGRSVNKFLKIAKIIVPAIVTILWGDPTTLVVSLTAAALCNN